MRYAPYRIGKNEKKNKVYIITGISEGHAWGGYNSVAWGPYPQLIIYNQYSTSTIRAPTGKRLIEPKTLSKRSGGGDRKEREKKKREIERGSILKLQENGNGEVDADDDDDDDDGGDGESAETTGNPEAQEGRREGREMIGGNAKNGWIGGTSDKAREGKSDTQNMKDGSKSSIQACAHGERDQLMGALRIEGEDVEELGHEEMGEVGSSEEDEAENGERERDGEDDQEEVDGGVEVWIV
ncbi:hypothetical protein BS47DRAFT_1365516 [Hydnum rufescens UP504]|uniref:Uncharacterized protein n=1 Tax=Hydnum rufescens UP504 TaxID=1448309 RepID=A0A9P6API0_9AGAM|nr:hypothetical protein BS47DRAFT_1365516 [Hydnum rufescens UP504]